ncbi:hypothetical protein M0R45_009373 [Rubus argutus]|uniref:Uncharacterized protein n=1 Tax=Rubus argutus TaxID=59490 RepID=A0AAW1Y4U2_RUBAR
MKEASLGSSVMVAAHGSTPKIRISEIFEYLSFINSVKRSMVLEIDHLRANYSCIKMRLYMYSVKEIPLYGLAEDEPSTRLFKTVNSNSEFDDNWMMINVNADSEHQLISTALVIQSIDSDRMEVKKLKHFAQKQVDAKSVALLLASNEAQEKILKHEETRSDAATHLESSCNEIRPAIEEQEREESSQAKPADSNIENEIKLLPN